MFRRVLGSITSKILLHLEGVFRFIEFYHPIIITYSIRKHGFILTKTINKYPNIGILIQGKIVNEGTELIETLKRYISMFPNIQVVISTWAISAELKYKLENLGAKLVLSNEIEYPGTGNINLQIQTTRAGIKAFSDDIEFVLKTRTDMRIYDPLALDYLNSIFQRYGKTEKNTRILVPSFGSMKFRCYSASDQLQYSTKECLIDFWSCDFMSDEGNRALDNDGEYLEISRPSWAVGGIQFAEEFLITQNMLRKNIQPDYTLAQSLRVYREDFVIINENNLDLVWIKNSKRELHNRSKHQTRSISLIPLTDWEWESLNTNYDFFLSKSIREIEMLIDSGMPK
jgi:hypothetical protein